METQLRARLLADATVSGLVGTRVDWGLRLQGKPLPAVRLTMIGSPRDYTMAGAQVTQHYRVQADCYAATKAGSKALADAVRDCLEPPSGAFQASFVNLAFDNDEATEMAALYCRVLDFRITYVSA